jgi:nicotinate-nucleotide adenylyltransferase
VSGVVEHAPLGLLGGTFDPVHYGHLRLADDVQNALALPEVRLVPAGDPPHRGEPHASAVDRLAMLDLACQEFPGLTIDPREIGRAGKSYTVLTLEELRAEDPGRSLLWIIGADSVLGLPRWHRWRELFELAHLIVAERPGVTLEAALPQALAAEWNARLVLDPADLRQRPFGAIYRQRVAPQSISASAIRAAIARGAASTARGLLPDGVLAYIEHNGLYRAHRHC